MLTSTNSGTEATTKAISELSNCYWQWFPIKIIEAEHRTCCIMGSAVTSPPDNTNKADASKGSVMVHNPHAKSMQNAPRLLCTDCQSTKNQMQNMEIQMKNGDVDDLNFNILNSTKNETAVIKGLKENRREIEQVDYCEQYRFRTLLSMEAVCE